MHPHHSLHNDPYSQEQGLGQGLSQGLGQGLNQSMGTLPPPPDSSPSSTMGGSFPNDGLLERARIAELEIIRLRRMFLDREQVKTLFSHTYFVLVFLMRIISYIFLLLVPHALPSFLLVFPTIVVLTPLILVSYLSYYIYST